MRVFHLNLLSSTSKRLQHVQVSLRVARESVTPSTSSPSLSNYSIECTGKSNTYNSHEHILLIRTELVLTSSDLQKMFLLAKQVLRCGDRVRLRFVLVSLSMVACVRACLSDSRISISTSRIWLAFFYTDRLSLLVPRSLSGTRYAVICT